MRGGDEATGNNVVSFLNNSRTLNQGHLGLLSKYKYTHKLTCISPFQVRLGVVV